MTSALIHLRPTVGAPALADDLAAAGIHVLGACERQTLVQDAIRLNPDVLICHDPRPDAALFDALAVLKAHAPCPVLLFCSDPDAGAIERSVGVGVQVYAVKGYGADRLRPLIHLAQVRFRHDQRLREQLDDVTSRFEERKLVDRAKGLLMRARKLPEDEAFGVLRSIAMRSGQRIGDVSRQVIDAARSAADVNRSGQLRMLSQRIVKLQALRVAGTRAAESAALLGESVTRVQAIVAGLTRDLSAPTFGDLVGALAQAWLGLQDALQGEASAAGLLRIDDGAEQMLLQSDLLTAALETAGDAPTLRWVNVCGRQRMLAQRLAKQALLAHLLSGAAAAAQQAASRLTVQDFESGVAYLESLPLGGVEVRAALAAAAAQWHDLRAGADDAARATGRERLAGASEVLLDLFDGLTGHYEHSLQVLAG